MEIKRYKPRFDKTYVLIYAITNVIVLAMMLIPTIIDPHLSVIIICAATVLFVNYFVISPMFGYAELRENALYVKFGFILKREIPYDRIRGIDRHRKFYSDSLLSLKNALDHINVKYNMFDMISISIKDEADFISEICERSRISTP